jgi:serine/threonine protein phosphatase PrpC
MLEAERPASADTPAPEPAATAEPEPAATAAPPTARRKPVRRRTRLARGPVTIGEPAADVAVQLATAEPYRPDTVADGGDAFGLTVRAASVRGLYKRHLGGPRQDDLCLRLHAPTRTVIVAVADGVSAAPRSGLAAALAVRHAAACVGRQLERGVVDLDWAEVFRHASWALVEEHRRAGGDAHAGVDATALSLATTLTVAVLSPCDGSGVTGRDAESDTDASDPDGSRVQGESDTDASDPDGSRGQRESGAHGSDPHRFRVQAAAVGDSPAYLLADGAFAAVLGDTACVDGLIGGGTRALPRDAGAIDHGTRMLESGSVLLICTDGLALPLADGTGDVGQTLARELAHPPDIIDFARLLDFSRATYDDDRTLIAVWPG